MYYPKMNEVSRYREMTNVFGGYNHTLSCAEGEFYDTRNMTTAYYPVLSPRNKRGICKGLKQPSGILDKEELMWIDDGVLYIDGKATTLDVTISTAAEMCPKTMAKMGAYVVIFPDKVWYNADDGTSGYMEAFFETSEVSFSLCDERGVSIEWHDEAYYDKNAPASGDYCLTESNGKSVLKQWSASTSIWVTVNTTYLQIAATGIGKDFKKEDGIKITADVSGVDWADVTDIFVNDEGNGKYSVNTYIADITDDCITIIGLLPQNKTFTNLPITVERKVPDMAFITECNNRLWGCSTDGHEVYCCKLGDVTNWNCFMGIATDSWAATIGTDGKFTGAITYLGYPIFFKEDSLLKIAVSSYGGHQTKETYCRGVQKGSEKSLCIMNEILYYKGTTSVCAYDGSLPVSISEALGETRYCDAVGGSIDNRYYVSMRDAGGRYQLFVYDSKRGFWCKEDNTAVLYFCRHDDELYYIDRTDNCLKSICGTLLYDGTREGEFRWEAESGNIGYALPDNKYVSRISIRLTMDFGTNVDFYLQYNSSGTWEHKFNMSGKGTRSFTIPVIPKRCDHFKYKIAGKGECKIHSITKTIEEGSDI